MRMESVENHSAPILHRWTRIHCRSARSVILELGTWNLELSFLSMPNISLAITKPPARRDFLLRKELHAFFALHVQVAEKGIVPAVERKPSHRRRHANVDAHHAAVDAMLEFSRGLAVARKNRCAVAERRT